MKTFVDYFNSEWSAKQTMFMTAYRTRAEGFDTNNTIEAYHGAIKKRFIDLTTLKGARLDKLLYQLLCRILPHYEDIQFMEDNALVNEMYDAKVVQKAFENAKMIKPKDVDVVANGRGVLDQGVFEIALVLSSSDVNINLKDGKKKVSETRWATVTGLRDTVDDREFVNNLKCDCALGLLSRKTVCACKILAAQYFRRSVMHYWYRGVNTVTGTSTSDEVSGDRNEDAPILPTDYSDEDLADGADVDDDVVDESAPKRASSKRIALEAKAAYNEDVLNELQHKIRSAENVSDELKHVALARLTAVLSHAQVDWHSTVTCDVSPYAGEAYGLHHGASTNTSVTRIKGRLSPKKATSKPYIKVKNTKKPAKHKAVDDGLKMDLANAISKREKDAEKATKASEAKASRDAKKEVDMYEGAWKSEINRELAHAVRSGASEQELDRIRSRKRPAHRVAKSQHACVSVAGKKKTRVDPKDQERYLEGNPFDPKFRASAHI